MNICAHSKTHTHTHQNKYTSGMHFEIGYHSHISSKITTTTYGYLVEEGQIINRNIFQRLFG
jgi:hypothetical protein